MSDETMANYLQLMGIDIWVERNQLPAAFPLLSDSHPDIFIESPEWIVIFDSCQNNNSNTTGFKRFLKSLLKTLNGTSNTAIAVINTQSLPGRQEDWDQQIATYLDQNPSVPLIHLSAATDNRQDPKFADRYGGVFRYSPSHLMQSPEAKAKLLQDIWPLLCNETSN